MKLSARNKLKGTIVEVKKGRHHMSKSTWGAVVTASIKASDVMVGVD
jgi:molybdopterin-binding protein